MSKPPTAVALGALAFTLAIPGCGSSEPSTVTFTFSSAEGTIDPTSVATV